MNDPARLYISDCPEAFTSHGRLFHAPLPTDGSVARLLFDHVNGTSTEMRVIAGIVNTDGILRSVRVAGGTAGPNGNWMEAGHIATMRYIQAAKQDAPTVIVIAANDSALLFDDVLSPRQCVAGIIDIDCGATGRAYDVRVIACDPSRSIDAFDALPEAPDDGKSRRGIFDISGASLAQALVYPGTPVAFEIGSALFARAKSDPYGGPPHKGEYGVLRRFNCTLLSAGSVWLYQSARAGLATATYLINDTLLASHSIPAGPRSKVSSFRLTAGQPQGVTIITMAEINSSYPMQLSFDSDDPTIVDAQQGGSPVYAV
jgi:hypothetical protein